jgi:shikimate dehydrogenase
LPKETQFLKIAREAGAKTLNGLNMLHAQADESYRIWMNSKT